jgi:hypothetical protein
MLRSASKILSDLVNKGGELIPPDLRAVEARNVVSMCSEGSLPLLGGIAFNWRHNGDESFTWLGPQPLLGEV